MTPPDSFSVDRVADLARLQIDKDAREKLNGEMQQILSLINILDELNLEQVEPFFGMTPAESRNDFAPQRADVVKPSIERGEILKNAPDHDGESYVVPPVFE